MNYYEVLGLDNKCSLDDIKQAYKTLALKYHPDKNKGETTDQFRRINEAYQFLKDPDKRRIYDDINITSASNDYSDILNIIMTVFAKFLNQRQAMKKDIRLKVNVDLLEVYRGDIKKIIVNTKRFSGETVTKTLYIPLVDIQDSYIFDNQGDEYAPGSMSNIVIEVDVKDHELIKRDKLFCAHDLYIEMPMTLYEYYNGVNKTIKHFDNKEYNITCSRNSNNSEFSMIHIIYDIGLPYTTGTTTTMRGNLYVYFRLQLPESISPTLNTLLKDHFNVIK